MSKMNSKCSPDFKKMRERDCEICFKELVQVKASKSKISRAGWRPREELILQLKIKGSQEAKLSLRDLSDLLF